MSGAGAPTPIRGGPSLGDEAARLPTALQDSLNRRDALRVVEPDNDEPEQQSEEEHDGPAHLRGEFDENLALKMSDFELASVANELIRGIEQDIRSRTEWESIAAKAIDYLGLKIEAASSEATPEGSVSKVFHTLLLESAVYFWANAHAELLPAAGPVKVRDDEPSAAQPPAPPPQPQQPPQQGQPPAQMGAPPPPTPQGPPQNTPPPIGGAGAMPKIDRATKAQAFEMDMNHYLTVVDRQYYRDFSRMLFSLGPMGTEFRKVYWCPVRKRPVSEWVKSINLIVSNDAADLSTAARITERIMMRHASVKRLQVSGWWRNVPLTLPNTTVPTLDQTVAAVTGINLQQTIPADFPHTIYECYTELELPGYGHEDDEGPTGLPLPYRVTLDKDSRQILEIRRNWKEGDINLAARSRYVMYGMVPGLGFYYLGYIHILGNTQRALTAIERQLIDAGQFANFPGFAHSKGAIKGTNEFRVAPGSAVEVNTGDKRIMDVLMPLPYKDVSPGLLKLMETISSDGRKLSSIAEMPVGEGRADVPVGTVVAMIEQTTKVMNAVHKGLHSSMQEELLLLKEQFAEDPTALWAFAKTPARHWEMADEFEDVDLVPASDPNIPSQLHRTMQAMALFQIAQQSAQLGVLNLPEVLKRMFRTLNVPDMDALFENPTQPPQQGGPSGPPPPDPAKMAQVQIDAMEQQRKAANEQQQMQLQAKEMQQKSSDAGMDRAVKLRIAQMEQEKERERLAAEMQKHQMGLQVEQQKHVMGIQADQQKHQLGLQADMQKHQSQLAQNQQQHQNEMADRELDRQAQPQPERGLNGPSQT